MFCFNFSPSLLISYFLFHWFLLKFLLFILFCVFFSSLSSFLQLLNLFIILINILSFVKSHCFYCIKRCFYYFWEYRKRQKNQFIDHLHFNFIIPTLYKNLILPKCRIMYFDEELENQRQLTLHKIKDISLMYFLTHCTASHSKKENVPSDILWKE